MEIHILVIVCSLILSAFFSGMEISKAETFLTEAGLSQISTEKLGTLQNQDNLEASPYIISANVP